MWCSILVLGFGWEEVEGKNDAFFPVLPIKNRERQREFECFFFLLWPREPQRNREIVFATSKGRWNRERDGLLLFFKRELREEEMYETKGPASLIYWNLEWVRLL
jgi:hypothetical protein